LTPSTRLKSWDSPRSGSVTATDLRRRQRSDRRAVGLGSCAPRRGERRVATPTAPEGAVAPLVAHGPRHRPYPSRSHVDGTQLGRGAVVVDGEAQASPTFPVELCSETTPGGLILAGERPGLPLGPTRIRVGFRYCSVSSVAASVPENAGGNTRALAGGWI
jgi:hypothetical protein